MSNVEVRVSEIEGPVEMDDKSDSESKSDVYLDDSEEDMILGLDDGFGDYATMNLTPKEVIEKLNNDLQHGVNPTFTKDMEGDYKSE